MSGFEQQRALAETMRQAFEANDRARRGGVALATANADFRAKRAAEVLRLRAAGMPASTAHDAAYADEGVNRALMLAEVAQADYDADREEVNLRKREADILRDQIRADWAAAGRVV